MRKHILSNYSEQLFGDNLKNSEVLGKTTYETSTVEVSDHDEFINIGSTMETRVKEDSDPDEFRFGPTNLTKTIENTDSDDFTFGPTMLTEQVENSDPDEFVIMGFTRKTFSKEDSDPDEFLYRFESKFCENDFDEILLI